MSLRINENTTMSPASFWSAANILINKPHVVNKRLWGTKTVTKLSYQPVESLEVLKHFRLDSMSSVEEEVTRKLNGLEMANELDLKANEKTNFLVIELLPKNYSEHHAFQLVCVSKERDIVMFCNITPRTIDQKLCPDFPFSLHLQENFLVLEALCEESSKSFKWLTDTVLPQFMKWAENVCTNISKSHQSLTLVAAEEYYNKYNILKVKYGKEMVDIWPECTDPSKFVYEDIAIATYLLLLWEKERQLKGTDALQTFVDLGCGNGLLVYILTMEGHQGCGIDVRRRQIWDLYPKTVKLEEKTIIPSDIYLFPDTDWIIGNHSDELTPWIPVITAMSAYKCNFFLLPCCAYNFDGTKYQRYNASKSQYTEYLEYIRKLCNECGFNIDMDRLKIPSTKRLCLVSNGRIYPETDHLDMCEKIQNMLGVHNVLQPDELKENKGWLKNFKPREGVEKVRNCTQIKRPIIESLINSITKCLLEELDLQSDWSPGKSVSINDIVHLLPQSQLNALKDECGGLQTVLRNNHHIFKVQGGKVQLRYPRTIEEVGKEYKSKKRTNNAKIQIRPCWFFTNHPQGCPLTNSVCSFLHDK